MNIYNITALLPMKGNSERVPAKNLKNFGGKPLFFHILESLIESKYISDIIINTDSYKIIYLVEKNFDNKIIHLIERPKFLLGAKVPMTPIIKYDLGFVKTEHFIQVHATTPLLKSITIDKAIETYFNGMEKKYDSLIGVNKYQTRFYDNLGKPINHNPDIMVPSQDMPPIYEDNSNFYINSKKNFLKHNNRVGRNPIFFEVNKLESIDIDDKDDFLLAEAVYYYIKRK